MNFRKKPVVVEAMQFTYPPSDEFVAWFGQPTRMTKARHPGAKAELEVLTLEDGADARAKHVATEGDWIIRGVKGELYPCKPDIFAATYEPAHVVPTDTDELTRLRAEVEALRASRGELLEAGKLVIQWFDAESDHSRADFYQRMKMCRTSEVALRDAIDAAMKEAGNG